MEFDRRSFLKGLLGTTALVALPVSLISPAFASGGVIPVTVKFYMKTKCAMGEWSVYTTALRKLNQTDPDTYLFKLDTREFTK